MDYPTHLSFTITNACNLRCWMCGQWSEQGYMRGAPHLQQERMQLADWERVAEDVASHGVQSVLLRGGEPFLHPQIIPLLRHLRSLNLFVSIDSNGTLLTKYAEEIAALGNIHITISVDGPEEIHDRVRGVKGTYQKIRDGLASLRAAMERTGKPVSTSLNFTISPESVSGLGTMPDTARDLGLQTLCIVPYYYIPKRIGEPYEREMREVFRCRAFSWKGFQHETSGIDSEFFLAQLRQYKEGLRGLTDYPYMPLRDEEYRAWFEDPESVVRTSACGNVERLLDIQPSGDANFCVDFPDYIIGNVREQPIADIWNGDRAKQFREYRRKRELGPCHRCGAKYMSDIRE